MDFHGIDLNLLAAFDALMTERHVTRAAARVGVSQPAMSAALARLRRLFDDALFLRSAEGLLPSAKARDLAEPISQALRQIETALLLSPATFDASNVKLTLNVGLAEYPSHVLLPQLVKSLASAAPRAVLNVKAFVSRDQAVDLLDAGRIDLAIGVAPTQAHGRIVGRPLFDDDFVTIVRRHHPRVRGAMDLATFLSLDHILASPEGDRHGHVDEVLSGMGKERHLALTVPHMFTVPAVVADSDMTATLMRRVVGRCAVAGELDVFAPPVAMPRVMQHLLWHKRNDGNPAQRWLRGLIAAVSGEL